MRTIKNLNPFNKLIAFSLIMTFISCGSYQGSSYYTADGIYASSSVERTEELPQTQNPENGDKYEKYFSNIADDYSSIDDQQNFAYTDAKNYSNKTNNDNIQVNSQAPWGAITSKTEVYLVNNNPWNGFYGNSFGFGGFSYGGFHNPYWSPYRPYNFYRGYYQGPLWGIGFFSPFQNFGYGYNHYSPYYRYNNYGYINYAFNRPFANYDSTRGNSRYSRSKTSRGGRSSQTTARVNQSNNRATISKQGSGISTRVSGAKKVVHYNAGRSSQNHVKNSNVSSQASNNLQPNSVRSSPTTPKKIIYSTNTVRNSTSSRPATTTKKSNSTSNQNYNTGRSSSNTSNYKSTNYNSRRSSSSTSYNSGRNSSSRSSSSSQGGSRSSGRSSRGR